MMPTNRKRFVVILAGTIAAAAVAPAFAQPICVPWQGDITKYHTALSGVGVKLKGVIRTANISPIWYQWNFGDGSSSGVVALGGSTQYNVETTHVYTAAEGTPFTARLGLDTVDSTMANVVWDNYLIQITPNNVDAQVNMAIDKALWYLHKQMIRTSVGSPLVPGGYWNDNGWYVGRTGACVWAFEVQGHQLGGESAPLSPTEDPYVENVQRGINYILSRTYGQTLNTQTHGDPDHNGNGIGLVSYYGAGQVNYETGLALGAISGCGTPLATADTGQAGNVLGRTYADIAQDMVEWYAWSQIDHPSFPLSGARGGWYYTAANNTYWPGSYGDNSACQWAYIGIEAAEKNFGSTFPQWSRDQLAGYLGSQLSYGNRGWLSYRANYTSSPNVCLTGGALAGMALVGQPTYDAVNGANAYSTDQGNVEAFLGTNWQGTAFRWTENWYSHRAYYTMYAVMKGLRLNGIDALPGAPGTSNWYDDYVSVMIPSQYSDGHWRGSGWMDGYIREDMGTAFGVLILTPSVFSPPPIACFDAGPSPTYSGFDVTFNPSCSDHSDSAKDIGNLVLFEWDWDNDGVYDQSTTTPVEVTHSWTCATLPCNYPVRLRVTDDSGTALAATFTLDIRITDPPHAPFADADGPYLVSLCGTDSLTLDGSASSDPNEGLHESGCAACPGDTITAWAWDLTPPITGFDDEVGETVTLDSAGVAFYFGAGLHNVGLRVTDNTVASYPSSGEPGLTNADFTTVEVHDACTDCDFTATDGCQEVILSWSASGDYEVLRSMAGVNSGFVKVGDASGTDYNDGPTVDGTTYYYRLKGSNGCLTNAVRIDHVWDCFVPPVCQLLDPGILDGGFEDGGAGWEWVNNGGRSVVDTEASEGTHAQQMLCSREYEREVYQDVAVAGRASYEAGVWVKTEGVGGAGVTVSLIWLDATGLGWNIAGHTLRTDVVGNATGTTDWTHLMGQFVAPTGAAAVRFDLYTAIDPDHQGAAWFDAAELRLCPDPVDPECPGQLLFGAGFENGGDGWEQAHNGGRSIVATESHGGDHAMQIITSTTYDRHVVQEIPVDGGTWFEADVWGKTDQLDGVTAQVLLEWKDAAFNLLAVDVVGEFAGTGGWEQQGGQFQAPTGAVELRVVLYTPVDSVGGGTAWLDDLCVQVIP